MSSIEIGLVALVVMLVVLGYVVVAWWRMRARRIAIEAEVARLDAFYRKATEI